VRQSIDSLDSGLAMRIDWSQLREDLAARERAEAQPRPPTRKVHVKGPGLIFKGNPNTI